MARFTIGQVSRETGLAASAIRYYEREGLLPKAPKEGGRRVYDAEVLNRLGVIVLAKRAGMSIAETRELLGPVGDERPAARAWQRMAEDKLIEIDERIASLERMKTLLSGLTECACPTLEDCGRAVRSRPGC